MDNKLNNMINDFLKNTDAKDDKELNMKLQEFIKSYNAGEIEYQNTPLDDAYELLEEAEKAKSKKQALALAQEAYEKCPECFDALLFQYDLEDSALEKERMLNEGLEIERKNLQKKKYFEKENIGSFYGIFETRPYIRGLYRKAMGLLIDGKIKMAKAVCEEILKLNENDNLGARYLLMAIYAYFEDEKNALRLFKKYQEEQMEMLFPLFAIYYKNEQTEKAVEYLNRIQKSNPHFLKWFKNTIKKNPDVLEGYYQKGDSSEVIMYFNTYFFLTDSLSNLDEFVIAHLKNIKE